MYEDKLNKKEMTEDLASLDIIAVEVLKKYDDLHFEVSSIRILICNSAPMVFM